MLHYTGIDADAKRITELARRVCGGSGTGGGFVSEQARTGELRYMNPNNSNGGDRTVYTFGAG